MRANEGDEVHCNFGSKSCMAKILFKVHVVEVFVNIYRNLFNRSTSSRLCSMRIITNNDSKFLALRISASNMQYLKLYDVLLWSFL